MHLNRSYQQQPRRIDWKPPCIYAYSIPILVGWGGLTITAEVKTGVNAWMCIFDAFSLVLPPGQTLQESGESKAGVSVWKLLEKSEVLWKLNVSTKKKKWKAKKGIIEKKKIKKNNEEEKKERMEKKKWRRNLKVRNKWRNYQIKNEWMKIKNSKRKEVSKIQWIRKVEKEKVES